MRKLLNILVISASLLLLMGCKNQYLVDYYIAPKAAFTMSVKDTVSTLESVLFKNAGEGQTFAIWTGDANHAYGKAKNIGFTVGSSGIFSYSYREPGTYTVVWVASSIKADGTMEHVADSMRLVVIDNTSGIEKFIIAQIDRMPTEYGQPSDARYAAKGEFLNDTILCPVLYESWKNNRVKSSQLYLDYLLTSTTATLWYYQNQTTWKKIRSMTDNIFSVMNGKQIALQSIKVVTSSGVERPFKVAAIIIPKLTAFSINGVKATIKHNVSSYSVYDVTITLPKGINLSALQPVWTLMDDDANLLNMIDPNWSVKVNGVDQVSGTSIVDFSKGVVTYDLYYQMLGESNKNISQTAKMNINVQVAQ